jgi:flagellar motor switch protein FliM
MTTKPKTTKAQQVSLVRQPDAEPRFPGLDRIGDQLVIGLRDCVASLGCAEISFARGPVVLTDFGSWRASQAAAAAIRLQLKPVKGSMLVSVPAAFIMQLVDMFFGGSGEHAEPNRDFSGAEQRFLERFGEQSLAAIACAWQAIQPVVPMLVGVESNLQSMMFCKDKDLVVVQPFTIKSGPLKGNVLHTVYTVAALRPIAALSDACDADQDVIAVDPVWRSQMSDAVLQVRLPLRSVFARPELPFSKLLTLQVGEVIPICLPTSIPITVAGRHFAMASVGEANGRAAIKIEKIQSGGPVYE